MISKMIGQLHARPRLYHWRTLAGAEVDIVLARDGLLYPIEFKSGTRIDGYDSRGIKALKQTYGDVVQHGLIVYAGRECYKLNEFATVVPFNAVMRTT